MKPRKIEEYKKIEVDGMDIADLIDVLDGLTGEGFTHLELDNKYEYYSEVLAVRERLETPEEVEMRLKRESWLEDRERAEYERLRAKYGNVD